MTKCFPSGNVDDCYKGVIAIKSPEKMETYLPKFPVESRNDAKDPQYKLRCWSADYDNIFKSAIMSMVGVMGKIPAKVEFGSADQVVQDLDMWGNEYDDRLVGIKARLNHAQTLFGRYGLWLTPIVDADGRNPQFTIKEYTCYQITDGETYISPFDGKKRLRWIKLDESKPVFDYQKKRWGRGRRYRILGLDAQHRYYSTILDGAENDSMWEAFDILYPENFVHPDVAVMYPLFKG